jgi:acetyl-CoA carboxylase biotin carboxylase subunit
VLGPVLPSEQQVSPTMLKKVLIANRGEIAVRVIRACRELGIATVAVFSEVDRGALHVRLADEAYCIGPAPASESYLNITSILDAARRSGADAVHPGYGFLSEQPRFSRACLDAGLIFVGPGPEAQERLGDKLAARRAAAAARVPIAPGALEPVPDVMAAQRLAAELGYPVMLKAAGGGGGKGMRLVHSPDELPLVWHTAQGEARSAFGDPTLYLEKAIPEPRHVEVQILADLHGRVVALGERECSVQRRHQKVIEEAPSPAVTPELRRALCEAAVTVARLAGYTSAGTVEFLLDSTGHFYFLEMNARLQVEHPVTELVTGIDIVKWQLRIAAGEPLSFRQEDVMMRGAAIEARIYAEDPLNGFVPSTGTIEALREPAGPGVRVDSACYLGMEVPVYYDPLLAKLICWGEDRAEALARLRRALDEYLIAGVDTTLPFHRFAVRNEAFLAGQLSTAFVEREWLPYLEQRARAADRQAAQLAAVGAVLAARRRTPVSSGMPNGVPQTSSRWKLAGRIEALEGR